jgi:GAF domain-containing protein/HAMP domain-containing protein
MFASYLTELSDQVLSVQLGKTGYAYLIDDKNQLVAHPDLEPGADKLVDFSNAALVQALRQGQEPPIVYTDENGITWRAHYTVLDNGWAAVVQQQESELFQPYRSLQLLSLILISSGALVIAGLVWASMRQAVQPINSLTQTVKDIAAGNLERVASVESEDEVGTLARAFNIMTNQVRTLVGSLERRVAERTLDLEHRSAQLQAAAEVGRAAATIRTLDELLPVVTNLISERFGFYHVGIFLLDEQGEYAILRAANSPGGQRMLERGHKLLAGQQGIVGYVTSRREPRVVLNVGDDTAFFNNPDLSETQSEMALPLQVGGELLGVLDVQSDQPNAFTEQDVETLQVLADQVAIAINSAQLLQRTEELLESERRGFGGITQRSWFEMIQTMENVGFVRERSGLHPITMASDPRERQLLQAGRYVIDHDDSHILYMPVGVRGQVIGVLKLVHDQNIGGWIDEEIEGMKSLAEQLGVALESARAYQQTQISARRDRILGEISARVRETLDVPTILQTATQEIRQVLDLPKVVIRLGTPPENDGNGKSDTSGGNHA